MATLTFDLEIRDSEPWTDNEGFEGEGHIWWMFNRERRMVKCDRCKTQPVAWSRDTMAHPNCVEHTGLCGSCASEMLREIPSAEVWAVIQGLEFGYAWSELVYQDKDGAEQ